MVTVMLTTYNEGDYIKIVIDQLETMFEIKSSDPKIVRLIDCISGISSERKTTELDELIVNGTATIHQQDERVRGRLKANSPDFSTYY